MRSCRASGRTGGLLHPILVPGTWSWRDDRRVDWYCPGHPFGQFLADHGVAPCWFPSQRGPQPFVWTTQLDGLIFRMHRLDWAAGGAALAYYTIARCQTPGDETAIIAHSHGLQVVLFACAEEGLRVRVLISVGSPVRRDLWSVAQQARPQIQTWLHVHSDASDRWQWLGEIGDGLLGIVRAHPLADRNTCVPRVGHSRLLRDPTCYHEWVDRGWIRLLRDGLLPPETPPATG